MDNEPNTHMQVDPSTNPMSAIQAFKMDPSNEWVIESVPGFFAIKHKLGCSICDASASHCMAAKRSYKIRLAEKDVSHAVAEAWPELVRYQDDYYRLLEDHNVLKESLKSAEALAEERRAKTSQLYDQLDSRRVTVQNLTYQVQSLEKELQEAKDNSAKVSCHEDLILENKRLKRELDYYVGRARYALHGKDIAWAEKNGYRLSDIPASDGEDDDEDPTGLPTIPEDIPQYIPVVPPNSHARITSKKSRNDSQVIREAGIPAIGGYLSGDDPKTPFSQSPGLRFYTRQQTFGVREPLVQAPGLHFNTGRQDPGVRDPYSHMSHTHSPWYRSRDASGLRATTYQQRQSKTFSLDFPSARSGVTSVGLRGLPLHYRPSPKHKRLIADPPTSITGVLPKPLGKSRAERWDQPAFRGASEWILEQDVHDAEMQRLYVEAKALPPHQRTPDHTAVMLRINEYARSLPGLPRNLVARHDDPDWMTDVIQSFNSNASGVPRNLRLEGLHVNVDDTDVWYWVNLIKPKF
ncbi:hypothetical protein M422DRAFT_262837 [Sphaerobolus stellatus SS14]|uniref:Uncharacterized protein n=1 Tax=Sphaerobolus stellatus (strain SS14) TaxID=990650 RepID=A0A0C9TX91_SPHS4|nr:hypothetical protein M422DRAFT_262837 [Sphaerobolus stellatus SS14]